MRRRFPCIHGLMMYATVKYSGGHIRKTCVILETAPDVCSLSLGKGLERGSSLPEPALEVSAHVRRIFQPDAHPHQAFHDPGGVALLRRDAPVRRGRRVADRGLHVAEVRG